MAKHGFSKRVFPNVPITVRIHFSQIIKFLMKKKLEFMLWDLLLDLGLEQ